MFPEAISSFIQGLDSLPCLKRSESNDLTVLRIALLSNKALAEQSIGRHEQCISTCTAALYLCPDAWKPRLRRAKSYASLSEFSKARDDIDIIDELRRRVQEHELLKLYEGIPTPPLPPIGMELPNPPKKSPKFPSSESEKSPKSSYVSSSKARIPPEMMEEPRVESIDEKMKKEERRRFEAFETKHIGDHFDSEEEKGTPISLRPTPEDLPHSEYPPIPSKIVEIASRWTKRQEDDYILFCQRVRTHAQQKDKEMMEKMLGKLKGFGNKVLGTFGLSLDSFKMEKKPDGSFSLNVKK
ncbi:hypothetical protein ADUPG1_009150 [Aduncisulcus paluster]|uniref:Uncharacterized protein n=1 Tax=Aduncisulcus paluster TaxID=2918883 RepID=A0ABQ5KUJ6_9EUKA|nr:hypothetical protein ADUPG1_009150 [Aduncisulcus paluster]